MTTKLIGMKEFRANISAITKKARKGDIRFIVLRKNVPVLDVRAIDEKTFAFEKLAAEIKEARAQVKRGEFYTQEEVMKEFGLI